MSHTKKFLFASLVLTLFCVSCASNEVASNSPDDIDVAGSDVTSIDSSGLNSDLPPTTSAEAAPSADPVSKVNVSASATTETNIARVTPVAKVSRPHRRRHRRHHSVLAHHKHRRKHRKHSVA